MAATAQARAPRARSCRSPPRARKPPIPAAGHSFVVQIDHLRNGRIPLSQRMNQILRANANRWEISMALQDRLNAFKSEFESGRPPYNVSRDRIDLMHRATSELIASGQAQRTKKAGDVAPEFLLRDADGKQVSSRELLARGPLVISFYRGVWCPYCNMELQALQEALPDIAARGASLVAISPQTAPNSRKSQRDNKLAFPILSDVRSEVANAFGIRFALPDYLVALYKSFKNDLPTFNDDPAWVLPMPARYVIGSDGVIAYAEVNPDYTQRPDPSELLPVLDRLQASKAA